MKRRYNDRIPVAVFSAEQGVDPAIALVGHVDEPLSKIAAFPGDGYGDLLEQIGRDNAFGVDNAHDVALGVLEPVIQCPRFVRCPRIRRWNDRLSERIGICERFERAPRFPIIWFDEDVEVQATLWVFRLPDRRD